MAALQALASVIRPFLRTQLHGMQKASAVYEGLCLSFTSLKFAALLALWAQNATTCHFLMAQKKP